MDTLSLLLLILKLLVIGFFILEWVERLSRWSGKDTEGITEIGKVLFIAILIIGAICLIYFLYNMRL
jgi:hypothetical protein